MNILKELERKDEDFVFPPFVNIENNERYSIWKGFDFNRHLSVQRLDQILQKLSPTLTSCMFRYGHTEKLFRLGYSAHDIKEIGDWSSSRMPEIYASVKGLTEPQKKFANDTRMIK